LDVQSHGQEPDRTDTPRSRIGHGGAALATAVPDWRSAVPDLPASRSA